jgi:RecJ-like exonuclease
MEWKTIRLGGYLKDKALGNEVTQKVLRREKGDCVLPCAFCRGKGKIGFGGGGVCSICGGRGEVTISEPIRKCVFCNGSGKGEARTENSCVVCKGKGAITVFMPHRICPDCKGKGRQSNQRWPCVSCSGRGIVPGESV